ncbi:MAG: alpha-amylase [Deltaproteobacteria bacterium]|nr:alpha-amylase [Deltaproteobacteria bacterium]
MTTRKKLSVALFAAVFSLAVFSLVGACHNPEPGVGGGRKITNTVEDWRDEVIYQVMIDRFSDGDVSNNYNVDVTAKKRGLYQGGDWQGLMDKIPYLKELGVTAIWISPVVRNLESDAGFASYHGYWTQDFLSVNSHFGDLAKMQQMVDTLHAEGFKVILDIVTNHIGQLFYYDMNGNGQPDDTLYGGGGPTYGSNNTDSPGNLTRTSEWDPDYDERTVQIFTSLGEAGPAPLRWVYQPEINRVPVQPQIFQNPTWYNKKGRITVWENTPVLGGSYCPVAPENNIELCEYIRRQETLGDFPGGLKDLKTDDAKVRKALIDVFEYWIEVGDFDGFRIDTLKHVEHGFWKEFCPAMRQRAKALGKNNFLQFGEAFTGADTLLAEYTRDGEVDSVFYFSQMYALRDVFAAGEPTSRLEGLHEARTRLYESKPHADGIGSAPMDVPINFLDNHDVARFLNVTDKADPAQAVNALHGALVYLMTSIGIPCIYYGTEQQFEGGNDPGNRENMWLGNAKRKLRPFDRENPTFKLIKTLNQIRKKHLPLRRGDFSVKWASNHSGAESDAGIFAFERAAGAEKVLVVLNTKACTESQKSSKTSFEGAAMGTTFASGAVLQNVLPDGDANDSVTVGGDGSVEIEVPCYGAKILVVQP